MSKLDDHKVFKERNNFLKPVYNDGERSFPNLEAYHTHALACAIIEQAVWDWIALDYGRRGYCMAHSGGNSLVYRAEVESFFKGRWFEYLLSFALPQIEPRTVRKELRIEEPDERRVFVEGVAN